MSKLTLDRILQSQGFGTRKWCSELIADGEVSIAGKVIRDSRIAIETDGEREEEAMAAFSSVQAKFHR